MNPQSYSQENCKKHKARFVFSIRSILLATILVALVLAVNAGVGAPYGLLTAIPIVYAFPLLTQVPRTAIGGMSGLASLAALSELVNNWSYSRVEHWLGLIVFGEFGFVLGSALHAFCLNRKILASALFLAALATLLYIVKYH